ncbi:ATPase [Patellaria atrata CBS 101060]|uniref:ATPase n=1 Tax=Patellaria atrata CBS 101060 TaxID=1346257 RepID=A0A9P4SAV9_9PEZI|nr:ATPase [Patellaria atrata CBS 101060]
MAVPNGANAVAEACGFSIKSNANGESKADSNGTVLNGESKAENNETTTNGESKAEEILDTTDGQIEDGSISTIKNIYKSAKDADGNWTWVAEEPTDVPEAAENNETAKFAIIVRNAKSPDSRKRLEAAEIVIQSPRLKDVLSEVLKDYPGVACELKRLIFEAPFKPFVHRWADLLAYEKRRDLEETTREHLKLLMDTLRYEIGDAIKAFEDYVQHGVITYEHLWMVFQPGSVIVAEHRGPLSAFELERSEYMSNQCGNFVRLFSDCVDFNGSNFGRCREKIDIEEFYGTKKIVSLNAFPLAFHPDQENVRKSLIERGKVFEQLAGYEYRSYSGPAITWDREGNEQTVQVSGRIVVDINAFNKYSPYRARYVTNWNAKDLERIQQFRKKDGAEEWYKKKNGPKARLSPYHYQLCRSRTRGYSLKTKQWLDFFVDYVGPVKWNTNAFDNLVLDEEHKELILAFSESQIENRAAFDDVVQGKGKGIIMLLSGPPGVGKTLTAEAVAENMKVPLHTLSSGDLGSSPWEVESGLNNVLELVARWNAILLLDECDVFLEARSTHDLERNKIVSIFLRTLEYYEGILFLTTNRVDNIDTAFQSRIHVSMEYPDLTSSSRRMIWKNFLNNSSQPNEFSDEDLDELAAVELNGRQIKNILKTAQLLASRKKETLNKRFVETVLKIERKRINASA